MADNRSNRSPDFRFIPADVVGLTLNENSAKLIFGVEEAPGQSTDQMGIFLTPKTLKILNIVTGKALKAMEEVSGEIVIDDEKLRVIDEKMDIKKTD